MLFRIDAEGRTAETIASVSFSHLPYHERYDIQEWVLHNPELLGEPLLVVTSEYAGFDRTSERLDVLALDRQGKLVVVELKRSARGTTAELQALRYAAYCSTLTLDDAAEIRRDFLGRRGETITKEAALDEMRRFVEVPEFEDLDDTPRIILAADDYGPEVTATVLWLRSFGVDIRCVRLTPYRLGADLVVESSILIPLAEAEEYLVRRQKKDVARSTRDASTRPTLDEYLEGLSEELRPLFQGMRSRLAGEPDVKETVFRSGVSYRRTSDNAWITWLTATKTQARFILPEEEDFPEEMAVKSGGGWTTLRLRGPEELAVAKALLEARLARVRREGGSSVLTPG